MLVVYAPTDGTGELLSTWSLCEGRVCVWCHMDRLSGHKKNHRCARGLVCCFPSGSYKVYAHVVHTDKIETVVSTLAISERTEVE